MSNRKTRDACLRTEIRAALPAHVFRACPMRIVFVVPLVGTIVLLSMTISLASLPWFVKVLIGLVIGNTYGGLMFFAHEVAHGATARSRKIQDAVLYFACAIFCFSPHLWRVWHNTVHHSHTNDPRRDPDHFGTLEQFFTQTPHRRALNNLAPGMSLLSIGYLFVFFALQAQSVLWFKTRELEELNPLRRVKAGIDSILMLSFWIVLGCVIGLDSAIYVIVIPFLVANFVVLSYVLTNHMLMPLTTTCDILASTMSVGTLSILDNVHFHFSHHIEHHLFPSMPSSRYGLVRSYLIKNYGQTYVCPRHWRALFAILATPRIYETDDVLCNPFTNRRQPLAETHARWFATKSSG